MRQTLTKDRPVLFHIVDDARVNGPPPSLTGDLGLLHGDATHVRGHLDRFKGGSTSGDVSGLRGDISRLRGQVSHIHGDVPEGLSGYMTWIRGDVSNLRGSAINLIGDVDAIHGSMNYRFHVLDLVAVVHVKPAGGERQCLSFVRARTAGEWSAGYARGHFGSGGGVSQC